MGGSPGSVPGSNPGSAPGTGYSSPSTPTGTAYGQTAGLSQNAASALCYLLGFITGIVFLVWAPYNQNRAIKFHAWQSIFLHVAFIALNIILPAISHFIGFVLISLVDLAGFILWLYLLFSVYNGKTIRLPFIGDLAAKQANS
jgi:uncharacterized membrane protein